jgi:hypothetical protein
MLAAEALRLAAVEVLCPFAAIQANSGYPTLARNRVFDSRAVNVHDLDREADYTPVLMLYTAESGSKLRGELSDATDTKADAVLDVIGELAVSAIEGEVEYADAMADGDPAARLVLAALMAQARALLTQSQKGSLFRKICKQVHNIEYLTFAVPQLGLRFHRMTMRLHCSIRDDDFDVPAGELPEPMRTVFNLLPVGSYAKAKLASLAAHFAPDDLPTLEGVTVTTGPVQSGIEKETP